MQSQIVELATKYREIEDEHKGLTAKLKETSDRWQDVENRLLEAMVEEGVKSADIIGVGKLAMRVEAYLSVNAAHEEQFYQYLRNNGQGGLIKDHVNPKTRSAFLKEHLAEVVAAFLANGAAENEVVARDKALLFLEEKAGAANFVKRTLSLRRG